MKRKQIFLDGEATDYYAQEDGQIYSTKTNKILKGTGSIEGYRRVMLKKPDGKYSTYLVHRLIAEAFLPNEKNLPIVHHKDHNRENNMVSNLEWVTSSENAINKIEGKVRQKSSLKKEDLRDNWKPIKNNENYFINSDGYVYSKKSNTILRHAIRNGYHRIKMSLDPYEPHFYSVHILVYETFKGKIPEGYEVDHVDGNKDNNSIDNLKLASRNENMSNAYRNGHKGAKKIKQYTLNGEFIKEWESSSAAARELGCTYRAISGAAQRGGTSRGFRWKFSDEK